MKKKIILISSAIVCIAAIILSFTVIVPAVKHHNAEKQIKSGNYEDAITILKNLDSDKYQDEISECKYLIGKRYYNSGSYDKAIEELQKVESYKDSAAIIVDCKYKSACELFNAKNYKEAEKKFSEIADYEDSEDYTTKCNYNIATELFNSKKYDEAEKLFKQVKDYENSEEMLEKCAYLQGKKLYDEKKYTEALSYLVRARRDSEAQKLIQKIEKASFKNIKEKSSVFFGSYFVGSSDNGQIEPIEWTVLRVEENKALLFSKYVLFDAQYFTENQLKYESHFDWTNSNLYSTQMPRCYSSFFTGIEMGSIITDYTDKKHGVFTLSKEEIEQYYKTDEERIATRVGHKTQAAPYWLRSEAGDPDFASKLQAYFDGKYYKVRICAESVDAYGAISDNRLATEECGVRIAVWVDLSKI